MDESRRQFLIGGLGVLVAGCAGCISRNVPPLPPDSGGSPRPPRSDGSSPSPTNGRGGAGPSAAAGDPPDLGALARSRWTRAQPDLRSTSPMNGIGRITVHHEGHTPVYFSDTDSTIQRLEAIRRTHVERFGWADIGYHYIIDRAGRLWTGRDIRLQGAHARRENEHNIGVMLLGNFGTQTPTDAQYRALHRTLNLLMSHYRVPVSNLYTHRELPNQATACPGDHLQQHMVRVRRRS